MPRHFYVSVEPMPRHFKVSLSHSRVSIESVVIQCRFTAESVLNQYRVIAELALKQSRVRAESVLIQCQVTAESAQRADLNRPLIILSTAAWKLVLYCFGRHKCPSELEATAQSRHVKIITGKLNAGHKSKKKTDFEQIRVKWKVNPPMSRAQLEQ